MLRSAGRRRTGRGNILLNILIVIGELLLRLVRSDKDVRR